MGVVRRHFSTLDSTIQWAREHVSELDRDKITLVTADHQVAGIGSQGKKWLSPPNQNITASFCFFLDGTRKDIMNLPQILQLTTAKVLEPMGFNPKIKWPNDLLVSEKKLAGVLCNTFKHQNQMCVILSIGLNVNSEKKTLERIDQPATSLLAEGGEMIDLESLTQAISTAFEEALTLFLKEGFSPFIEDFRKRLKLKKGESINEDGSLNLKLPSGRVKKIY